MKSSSFYSIGLVVGCLIVAAGVQAATTSLAPDADSYVRAGSTYQGLNYGTATILAVKDNSKNASYNRVSFLRFQLGSFSDPISIAVLKLNCVSLTQGAATVDVYAVETDAWAENSITYLNKPALGAKLTSTIVAATGIVEIPLNVYARQQQLGDGVLSIALVQPANQNRYVEFASREAVSGKPALEVSFDPTPPVVTATTPVDGGTVDPLAPSVSLSFNKPMAYATVETAFSMGNLSGTFTWSGNTMTFKPTLRLRPNTTYTVTVGTGAQAFDSTALAAPCQFSVSTPINLNGYALTIACDNAYEIYLNGTLVGSGANWQSAQKYSNIALVPGKNVIAVKGTDAGGAAALLAELALNGQRTGTGSAWKVTLAPPADWTAVELDDSSWALATDYGAYGVAPWNKSVSGMPTDTPARWIWSSNNGADNLVYVRWTVDTAAVSPAPTNVTFSHISDRVVAFNWQPAVGANPFDYYEVYRDGVCIAVTETPSYRETTLTPQTRYVYTIRSVNVLGGTSPLSAPAEVTTLPAPPVGTGTGLLAKIYDDQDFALRTVVRVDPKLDWNWGSGVPATGVGVDTFSIRWEGSIQPRYTEQYTIYTLSDDGVRVWLDGQLVIDNWTDHSTNEDKGVITLQAGQKYDIRVDYYDNSGGARLALLWECKSQVKEVVPMTQLYPAELAEVKLITSVASVTSPAWVEGRNIADAVSIKYSVNGGATQDVVRESATQWYADTASAQGLPYGIPLDQDASTAISVSATDTYDAQLTRDYNLVWTPTILNDKSWSEDEIVIRVNDSLLFTVESSVPDIQAKVDANGDATVDYIGPANMKFPWKYTAAGQYTVKAWLGSAECGTLTVTVMDANLHAPIACEVGYQREKFIEVTPLDSVEKLSFVGNDPALLGVSVKGLAVDEGIQGLNLYMTAVARGTPILQARVNGKCGPLVKQQEVDEFTVESSVAKHILVDEKTGLGFSEFVMRPFIPNIRIAMTMFAHTATFAGGATSLSINTSDCDPETGEPLFERILDGTAAETIGVLTVNYEVPASETSYCLREQAFQSSSKEVEIKLPKNNNGKLVHVKSFNSLVFPREGLDEIADNTQKDTEGWQQRAAPFSLFSSERENEPDVFYGLELQDKTKDKQNGDVKGSFDGHGKQLKSDDKSCNGAAEEVTPPWWTGSLPGIYQKKIKGRQGSKGGDLSGYVVASRLDAHGVKDGTRDKFPDFAQAFNRRPGTTNDPVIQIDWQRVNGAPQPAEFYGTIGHGTAVCPTSNIWRFTARPGAVAGQHRIHWDTRGGTIIEGGTEASDSITVEYPVGRFYPLLQIIDVATGNELGRAEIHSLVVEQDSASNVAEKGTDVAVPLGTRFHLTQNSTVKTPVDACLFIAGSARGRVSLDGYPQNQYWATAADDRDIAQVLQVPTDLTPITCYLQGYGTPSPGSEDVQLHVQGQALLERPGSCMSWTRAGDDTGREPVIAEWQNSDDEPFTTIGSMERVESTLLATRNAVNHTRPPQPPMLCNSRQLVYEPAAVANLMVLPMNAGPVELAAFGLAPASEVTKIKWTVQRNREDTVGTALPALTSSADPLRSTLTPNTPGSFRVIVYLDYNESGAYEEGEELIVVPVGIVRATFRAAPTFVSRGPGGLPFRIVGVGAAARSDVESMLFESEVLLQGGGRNQLLGTARVHLGNVGNLLSTAFTVTYGAAGTRIEVPGAPLPMVDSSRVPVGGQPQGRDTPFRSMSQDLAGPPALGGLGTVRSVTSMDGPAYPFPSNLAGTFWTTTSGDVVFREFIVAYSDTFNRSYVSIGHGNWTFRLDGTLDPATGNWTSAGAGSLLGGFVVTDAAGTQSGDDSGVQVLGLSFVNQTDIVVPPANPIAPVTSSPSTVSGQVGVPFRFEITAANHPTGFAAAPLPTGLAVDATGAITGTPTVAGVTTTVVTVSNTAGADISYLHITIAP